MAGTVASEYTKTYTSFSGLIIQPAKIESINNLRINSAELNWKAKS